MVRALTRAMALTRQDGAQMAQKVRALFPQTEPGVFAVMEPRYRAASATTPVLSATQFQRLIDWMNLTSPQAVTVKYADFVDNRFASEAVKNIH